MALIRRTSISRTELGRRQPQINISGGRWTPPITTTSFSMPIVLPPVWLASAWRISRSPGSRFSSWRHRKRDRGRHGGQRERYGCSGWGAGPAALMPDGAGLAHQVVGGVHDGIVATAPLV